MVSERWEGEEKSKGQQEGRNAESQRVLAADGLARRMEWNGWALRANSSTPPLLGEAPGCVSRAEQSRPGLQWSCLTRERRYTS